MPEPTTSPRPLREIIADVDRTMEDITRISQALRNEDVRVAAFVREVKREERARIVAWLRAQADSLDNLIVASIADELEAQRD